MKNSLRVERIDFGPAWLELETEWEALLQRSTRPSIYASLDYLHTTCSHFRQQEEVFLLLMREEDSGELRAIFPISIWDNPIYGVHVRTVEHGILTTYTDVDKPYPIIDAEQEQRCWERFAHYLKREYRNWDAIVYKEIIRESYLTEKLKALFPLPGYWVKSEAGPESPIVKLDGEWDDFWEKHSNLRKKSRRLEKKIGKGFRYRISSDPADVEECLAAYIDVEMSGWKAGEGVSKPASQTYYRELLPKLAAKGQVFFCLMYDGDNVMTAELSFAYQQRVYFALGTYNDDYKKLSPGSVSAGKCIEFFFGKGYVDGDFLAGYASYINDWASEIDRTSNYTIRRLRLKTLYLAACHLKRKLLSRGRSDKGEE